ncbi:ArsR family transcriptional regulator [Caloranaerobacter sp. TR13]|uniref:autorepressor SdpR family transcription factor n=1 Tax=Caloranaerobacter sp. TR13 TaxID=1302151 RepID=UPI0006D4732A|nr:autorepressor SdpR family transcription factor [Caloranaerobacter sp. TR13]KPU26333.1 ArsR family transcriptional regulator [Caloranaerobacter sp. TR13]
MNKIFKALADPTRRKILELLKEKDLTAGEIADFFNISKPSISHHLNILKNVGLVLSEKVGQNIYYSLNTTAFQEIMKWIFDFMERRDNDEDK